MAFVERMASAAIRSRDELWGWTLKVVHHSDATQRRLGRGRRTLGKRHWADIMQRAMLEVGFEMPGHQVAQERKQWKVDAA